MSKKNGSIGDECTANQSCANSDDEDDIMFSPETDVLSIVLALSIVAINLLVIVLFARNRALRTANNVILVSLAVSDLLTGLLSLPMFVACGIERKNAVCFASIFPVIFTSVSTVSHLVAVTVDRLISIKKSLLYSTIVTKKRVFMAVGVIWFNALLVTLIQLLWLDPTTFDIYKDPPEDVRKTEIVFDSVCFVLYVGLPLPLMAVTYGWIFREVRRHSESIRRQNTITLQKEHKDRTSREKRAALIFFGMFFTYAVCWTPYFLLRLHLNTKKIFPDLSYSLGYSLMFFRFCSSFLNPCIYILGKQDFRKAAGIRRRRREKLECEATLTEFSRMNGREPEASKLM